MPTITYLEHGFYPSSFERPRSRTRTFPVTNTALLGARSCNHETRTLVFFSRMGHRVEFPATVCHPWSFERQVMIGIGLAEPTAMKFFCRHCEQITVGKPYRVISEEDGVVLLNMTVCRSCNEQARALGLHSEPISIHLERHRYRPPWVHALTASR
jgi:hypothetical protein